MPPTRSPVMAFLLSLAVPGLGQLYCGNIRQGLAVLVTAIGVWICMVVPLWSVKETLVIPPHILLIIGVLIHLTVALPAAGDARKLATGEAQTLGAEKPAYVITMLLLSGPFALPLLWQNRILSRTAKIAWTVGFIALTVLLVALMIAGVRFIQSYPTYY